jgi:hypothetical protein
MLKDPTESEMASMTATPNMSIVGPKHPTVLVEGKLYH